MRSLSIQVFTDDDVDDVVKAFQTFSLNKPRSQYEKYLREQDQGLRTILIARSDGNFVGYVTIVWQSDYIPFFHEKIPEIKDLNVLPKSRKNGVGQSLIAACEEAARARKCEKIGLGVGLLADYGSAQRLYCKNGYVPDGAGIHYGIQPVSFGQKVSADDDLVLYLSKIL